ncbi:MAG: septal ring lytic transglycosylase RlpA family protein [Cyanobacteria bacterium]|nr:septal ring lytic transglycosylase RlpA family protein [Cyanobacteriota bacterium]
MRATQLLGTAALLFASTGSFAPAMAATFSVTTPSAVIRELDAAPTWDQKLIQPMSPVPAANGLMASSGVSVGQASWYGPGFYGNRTASGEVFRPGTLTAAHRSLAFGTKVRVTNLQNGLSAVVRINDRGPFHGGRIIDLAHGAAQQLGVTSSGTAQVKLEILN